MTLSLPQPLMPRMAFSWALQTARGLRIVRSQSTTYPSASPVARRSFPRKNSAACTWALWPRRMDFGAGGAEAIGPRQRSSFAALGFLKWSAHVNLTGRRRTDSPRYGVLLCALLVWSLVMEYGVGYGAEESREHSYFHRDFGDELRLGIPNLNHFHFNNIGSNASVPLWFGDRTSSVIYCLAHCYSRSLATYAATVSR